MNTLKTHEVLKKIEPDTKLPTIWPANPTPHSSVLLNKFNATRYHAHVSILSAMCVSVKY